MSIKGYRNPTGFRRGKVIEGDGQLYSNRKEVMAQCIKHINTGYIQTKNSKS